MELNKRLSVIFLGVINALNMLAGIITQVYILTNKDIYSVIPIPKGLNLTVIQILLLNFMAVSILTLLISIVTLCLVTDVPYNPIEIIENLPAVFMALPIISLGIGIYNTVVTDFAADKIAIIVCSIIYTLICAFELSCAMTVKIDAEE